jgi:hypothetical protein
MGTSLTVQPFASLPQMAKEDVPRLLINQEQVGDLGTRADDVLLLGDCDSGVRKVRTPLAVTIRSPLESSTNTMAARQSIRLAPAAGKHMGQNQARRTESSRRPPRSGCAEDQGRTA